MAEFTEAMAEFIEAMGTIVKVMNNMLSHDSTEPNETGFVLVNGNTWLPRPLHKPRRKQQRKAARKNEDFVIWTR